MKLDKESELKKTWRKWRLKIVGVLTVIALLVLAGHLLDVEQYLEQISQEEGVVALVAERVQRVGWMNALLIFGFIFLYAWFTFDKKGQEK